MLGHRSGGDYGFCGVEEVAYVAVVRLAGYVGDVLWVVILFHVWPKEADHVCLKLQGPAHGFNDGVIVSHLGFLRRKSSLTCAVSRMGTWSELLLTHLWKRSVVGVLSLTSLHGGIPGLLRWEVMLGEGADFDGMDGASVLLGVE